jgi:hypothetical protein
MSKSKPQRISYRANFLFGKPNGSVEEAGYEFANANTEQYRKQWWRILLLRARAPMSPRKKASP